MTVHHLRLWALTTALAFAGCSSPVQPPTSWSGQLAAIVGGYEVPADHWMALSSVMIVSVDVNNPKRPVFCSGTLIARDVVLTAAHCASEDFKQTVIFAAKAKAESKKINKTKDFSKVRKVKNFVIHPDYNFVSCNNQISPCVDIALLKLAAPAPAPYRPMPLLSNLSQLQVGDQLAIQGFGAVRGDLAEGDDGDIGTLRATAVTIDRFVDDKDYIVLDQSKGTGMCTADSGGAAVSVDKQKEQLYLVGVNSRVMFNTKKTQDGAENRDPCTEESVVVGISNFIPWIRGQLKEL